MFKRRYYTRKSAENWLKKHNLYPYRAFRTTPNTLRFNYTPAKYKKYRTEKLPIRPSIEFVFGFN